MGNDNLRRSQVAVETTVGAALAPTRQLVGALALRNQPERVLREEYRASMGGSNVYDDLSYRGEGTYSGRCVTSELPMFLSSSIVEVLTPTTSVYTYTMPLSLAGTPAALTKLTSLCLYAGDQTQALRAAGCYVSRIVIRGSNTEAWTVEITFLTREVVVASGLNDFDNALVNAPNVTMKNLMGWIAIAPATGGMPTAPITATPSQANTFYSFTWTWEAGIAPDYTMDLQLDMANIHRDAPQATLEIVSKWNAAARDEFINYRLSLPVTPRLIRVSADGGYLAGSSGPRHTINIDGCYVYTDFVPLDSERDGTTLGRLTLAAIENTTAISPGTTWAKKIEVSVTNNRLTLAGAT
jgi:hypothetical protein